MGSPRAKVGAATRWLAAAAVGAGTGCCAGLLDMRGAAKAESDGKKDGGGTPGLGSVMARLAKFLPLSSPRAPFLPCPGLPLKAIVKWHFPVRLLSSRICAMTSSSAKDPVEGPLRTENAKQRPAS